MGGLGAVLAITPPQLGTTSAINIAGGPMAGSGVTSSASASSSSSNTAVATTKATATKSAKPVATKSSAGANTSAPAVDAAADILVAAGVGHVQVNAAGDLALRGGWFDSAAGVVKPWSIGVVNPDDRGEIVKVFEITDGAIATSGTYERGAHIHDPLNGLIAIGAKSATVVGAEGWLCDAMATAVMVGGQDSVKWFGQSELQGYQVFAVNRHEQSAWEI